MLLLEKTLHYLQRAKDQLGWLINQMWALLVSKGKQATSSSNLEVDDFEDEEFIPQHEDFEYDIHSKEQVELIQIEALEEQFDDIEEKLGNGKEEELHVKLEGYVYKEDPKAKEEYIDGYQGNEVEDDDNQEEEYKFSSFPLHIDNNEVDKEDIVSKMSSKNGLPSHLENLQQEAKEMKYNI